MIKRINKQQKNILNNKKKKNLINNKKNNIEQQFILGCEERHDQVNVIIYTDGSRIWNKIFSILFQLTNLFKLNARESTITYIILDSRALNWNMFVN